MTFNPVRESELASCSTDGTVRFWDVRSKTCVSRLDVGGEAFTLSWSADGRVLMAGRKVSEGREYPGSVSFKRLTYMRMYLGRYHDPRLR